MLSLIHAMSLRILASGSARLDSASSVICASSSCSWANNSAQASVNLDWSIRRGGNRGDFRLLFDGYSCSEEYRPFIVGTRPLHWN